MPNTQDIPVLICGGGLVGLSTAAFLAWHGVPVLLVERRSGALPHPRARAINPRTVEVYRAAGLEQEILRNRSRVYDEHAQIVRARTLAAPEIHRTGMAAPALEHGNADLTPCPWAPIDQDRLEILVRARAAELGANLRFGTELRGVRQAADGVTATIEDARGVRTVRASYLIAADGHRSPLRERLGIGTTGPGGLGQSVNFVFTADLSGPLRGRSVGIGHFDLPRPGTVLLPHDGAGRWVLGVPFDPGTGDTLGAYTPERCAELARAAIGVADLHVSVVPQLSDGTTVLSYEVEAKVATAFRSGRIFLVGDAAHVVPPTGAFGASTGVQDAHNLAWKLAAVLRGEAGPALLDSYDAERRPVAEFTLDQALVQMRERTGRTVPLDRELVPAEYDAVVFGYTYRSAAVIAETAGADDPFALPPGALSGRPGARAPHLPVLRDGRELSILDLFGRHPVLLTAPAGRAWATAMRAVAKELGVRVDVHLVGTDVTDPSGRFAPAYGLGPAGSVLVRPDGFVAWRSPSPDPDPERRLRAVLRQSLALG